MDSAGPDAQDALILPDVPVSSASLPPQPPSPAALPALPLSGRATGKTILIFEPDGARLGPLLEFYRRRVRAALWLLGGGVALGMLWLVPQVHTFPPQTDGALLVRVLRDFAAVKGQPWWVVILRVLGVVGLGLSVLSFFWLPGAVFREARLRRQSDLHLAVGRQGVLFFLPGQSQRWFLLPWQHMRALREETIRPDRGRLVRLRTVLWRRWARLARLYRHGRRLDASSGPRRAVLSPFAARAALQQPWLALHMVCTGRLPVTGYHWLFRLAPFTPRSGPASFRLETGWFVSLQTKPSAVPPASVQRLPPADEMSAVQRKSAAVEASPLHTAIVALWGDRSLADAYPALPLPRFGGAFHLGAPGSAEAAEARQIRLAAWVMLPLIPIFSLETVAQMLAQRQPLTWAAALNAAALSSLALGLALLLAGMQRQRRWRAFLLGALLLAAGGVLNVGYGFVAFLVAWPWRFAQAPGQPFLALEGLASLLILLGALALALEGSGRPGLGSAMRVPHTAEAGTGVGRSDVLRGGSGGATGAQVLPGAFHQGVFVHCAEAVLAVGLLSLGMARALEDVNLALLSQDGGAILQFLRNTLAEPLLPLTILGISYFGPLVNPILRPALRLLQAVYGLVLAVLVPVAFVLVQRALFGTGLPVPWLPLLALTVIGGLLAAWSALRNSGQQVIY